MKIKSVFRVLSFLLVILSAAFLIPMFISLALGEKDASAFFISILVALASGVFIYLITRKSLDIGIKESFGIVTFGWTVLAFFGCLPLYFYGKLSGNILSFTDCYFEIMSGFTTTGASILTNIEVLPKGILFWRSMCHWFGGMGIIVLTIAILPLIGVGGMQLFRAEAPGPVSDKITPRIKDTAKILWGVYVLFTVIEALLLWVGGMTLFDAFCHTFGTLATGGFSTKNASIGHYHSVFIQSVIIFFMFVAGANFTLHFQALRGKPISYIRNREFLVYTIILICFSTMIGLDLILRCGYTVGKSILSSLFQVVSIGTTTGYVTDDFEKWTPFCRFLLFVLMFIGGCGGSTGGGMKVSRIIILFKYAISRMQNLIHPQGIFKVRVGGHVVREPILMTVSGFFILFFISFGLSVVILSLLGIDFQTAIASTVACLGNIGPGLGGVGPTDNYAWLPAVGKWVLIVCMLLGRLEIYTVLLLFVPETWKK
jgi:trk system potassium uptake protein TrkH